MKSPHDIRVGKDFMFGVQELMDFEDKIVKENVFRKFITRCPPLLQFWRKKSADEVKIADIDKLYSDRLSTSAEIEIQSNTSHLERLKDTAVQTGSSLHEMQDFSSIYSKDPECFARKCGQSSMEPQLVESISSQHSDELNLLQFLRKIKARSISLQQDHLAKDFYEFRNRHENSSVQSPMNETEIRSEIYQHDYCHVDEKSKTEQPRASEEIMSRDIDDKPTAKHLRFQDDIIIMSPKEPEDDIMEVPVHPRRSIIFGVNKVFRIQEPEEVSNEVEESAGGSAREVKSYFNWGKEKKKKKPKKK